MAIYVDDKELVAAHQAGDHEAFDELVRSYRPALLAHGRRKLYCDAAAEDAVQETLVRAYRALPKFNGEYKLGPWLHRIMANVCIDEAVRRRRDGEKADHLAAQPSSRVDAPSAEQELGLEYEDSDLNSALDELSAPHRDALVMRFVDGFDYEQVADASGITEQNARARVSRARLTMKGLLKGVATLPVLLVGLLKRGEKAAAAASATGVATTTLGSASTGISTAIPALTETAAVAAPAAMPAIAKAAVGLGIAASVLAPTSDSAVHRAVGELVSGDETTLIVDGTELTASAGEGAVNGAATPNDSAILETLSPSVEFQSNTVQQEPATEAQGNAESLSLVTQVSGEELNTRNVGRGEYQVEGSIELTLAGSVVAGQLERGSHIEISSESDPEGRYRTDGLLLILTDDDAFLEIRLAGFLWGEIAQARVGGLFRTLGDETQTAERGAFDGQFSLGFDGQEGSLALRLTP